MAKWLHPDVLLNGVITVVNAGNEMWLVGSYTIGENYATVLANQLSGIVPIVVGDGNDYTVSLIGNNQNVAVAAKTGTANGTDPAPSNHIVIADGVRVLAVTKAGDQGITLGNPINFPLWNITAPQPV